MGLAECRYDTVVFPVWRTEDIGYVASCIIRWYAENLPELGTDGWGEIAYRDFVFSMLGQNFNWQNSNKVPNCRPLRFEGMGFSLTYVKPMPICTAKTYENGGWQGVRGEVVWDQPNPHVAFVDKSYLNLTPSYRDRLYKINRAVREEAIDTYKLVPVRDQDGVDYLVFPRHRYTDEISLLKGLVLDS